MIPRIIFCSTVILAALAVVLLALFSPVPYEKSSKRPWLALSFHIQHAHSSSLNSNSQQQQQVVPSDAGAFIFHRTLTEGPENTSRVIGKAQGFIIPVENFAHSVFNVIYLTLDTPEYSGSISVQANKLVPHTDTEELTVVGGTGTFAFARGFAIFMQTDHHQQADVAATYHVKIHLRFPDQPQIIPG